MLNITKSAAQALLLGSLLTLLGGCGGAGSDLVDSGTTGNGNTGSSSSGGPTPTPDPGNSQRLTLAINGLSGSLVLSANGVQQTQTRNGYVAINDMPLGDVPVTIVSGPDQQQCLFDSNASNTMTLTAASEVAIISCDDLLTLTGTIYQSGTETPLSGVEVSVHAFDGDDNLVAERSDTTGGDGVYLLEDIVLADFSRVTLTIDQNQYELFGLPISENPATLYLEKNYSLAPPGSSTSFDPAASQSLVLGTVEVDIPANSLVTTAGNVPSGNVTVLVSPLDASFAPELLPGGYTRAGGQALQNYGAASVRFFSGSEELEFADGAAATVRFPVALRASGAPADGEVHYFDRESGLWVATTNATMPSAGIYEISVNQSTVWGVFDSYATVQINGCVRDANGRPVADTLIITQGQEYIGRLLDYTNAYGNFSVGAKANASVFLYARSDVASQTISVPTQSSNISLENCLIVDPDTTTVTLTWGQNPDDLDTQLIGPNSNGGTFHINYTNRQEAVGNGVTIYLDVDDTTSYGPEVTTIPRFPAPGTYSYYVHRYSGTGNMFTSPTRIALFTGRVEYIFFVEEVPTTDCWHVFDIEVDSELEPTVIEVGESVDESTYCVR